MAIQRDFSDSVKFEVVKDNLKKNSGSICCEVCKIKLNSIDECHFDHIKPFAKGGQSSIDDFANVKMSEEDALQIFKVMEYRYGNKSTIIASQLEPKEWHRNLGASLLADSILDRIVSNSYKIILSGDSLRPKEIKD